MSEPSIERYGFTWSGKQASVQSLSEPGQGRLTVDVDRSIGPAAAENIFVEGDNLEVLKLLRPDLQGQVKLIYTDPPYNTKQSFVYDDDFSTKHAAGDVDVHEQDRRHGRWLSMMYPRLVLSRDLLADDGVIMLHIDEHEGPRLFLLLEEIFGPHNHLGDIVWDKRNPKGDSGGVSSQHELILVFARDRATLLEGPGLRRDKNSARQILDMAARIWSSVGRLQIPEDVRTALARNKIPESALEGHEILVTPEVARKQFTRWLRTQPFSGGELAYDKIDDNGDVYRLVSMAWPNKKVPPPEYFQPLTHPVTGLPCPVPSRGWRNPPATMEVMLAAGTIVFGPDETTQPQRKYLLKDNLTTNVASVIPYGGSDDRLVEELGIPFDTVKPVELIKPLVASCTSGSDIVLDFFAGSGSVAHAVALQNEEDGERRRCISINIGEPTQARSIARSSGFDKVSDLTYARLVAITERLATAKEQGLKVLVLEEPV